MERTRTIADRYVLGPRIAAGGMAEVYSARDEVLARTVAVKLLLPHLSRDESTVARFRQEALAAARLTHPNIVAIYDTGSDHDGDREQHYIVMEYCPAGSLSSALHQRGPFDSGEIASIGSTICDALGYAHAEGVIHRDIKPANVLVVEHGTLKVTDFGIAKAAFGSGDITTTGSIMGTVTYISPEQARGDEPDPRSDLYSLGVLMYELATGRPPFQGDNDVATALSHVRESPPPPRSIRAGIPRSLEAVILKALEKDPDSRYGSAEEMKHELETLSNVGGSPTVAIPQRPEVPERTADAEADGQTGPMPFIKSEGRRNAPVLLLVIAAVVAAAVIATLVRSQTDEDPSTGGSGNSSGQVQPVEPQAAEDFDPHGGDGEHPELVENASDGDPSTSWRTSTYNSTLEAQQKPGVGLLFDLGAEVQVAKATIQFDRAGYSFELRGSNSKGADETAYDLVESTRSSDESQVFEPDQTYRYWLVWLTAFPGEGGGRGSIQEVTFEGT